MPVIFSGAPPNAKELVRRFRETPAGKEDIILKDIQDQLGILGHAVWYRTVEEPMDVSLTTARCIVFLYTGTFKVGGNIIRQQMEAHTVENETMIQLQSHTAIAIIY